ncbi:family 20 glycosylhydrolase [bacterium]|nr:family 20 glycosylhydrolase [bacterium]
MTRFVISCAFLLIAVFAVGEVGSEDAGGALPVRGIHFSAPSKRDLPACIEFIKKVLPKEGVNTLILEFNYSYDYKSRPEFANPLALGKKEVRQIVKACRKAGIELIPQINCLGHQSWGRRTAAFLRNHPEFDETPGKYPENKGIYCRSYCPLHPEVHKVLFDLIDELAEACEAKSFHVGMDEVFIIGDKDCPRCGGKNAAELFAGEVQVLRDHLKKIGCRMWMWGDRFIDGKKTGIGKWDASENGTHPAVDKAPKDIIICDWHYGKAYETPRFFAEEGFGVVACPWKNSSVALAQLEHVRAIRKDKDKAVAARGMGMVQTTWCGFGSFIKAYNALEKGEKVGENSASGSARCFRELFEAIRKGE